MLPAALPRGLAAMCMPLTLTLVCIFSLCHLITLAGTYLGK